MMMGGPIICPPPPLGHRVNVFAGDVEQIKENEIGRGLIWDAMSDLLIYALEEQVSERVRYRRRERGRVLDGVTVINIEAI